MAASCTIDLRFRVINGPPLAGDTYNNVAAAAANEPDSNAVNSSESETTTVRVRADLQAVSKTASINPVNLNEPFNWTITVQNNGPGDSELTTVTDTLPAGMEISGGTPGYTKTAPAGSGNCAVAGNTITCAMGQLDATATATITVPVRITAFPGGGTASNTVNVGTNQVDFNPGNNGVTGNVTVRRSSIAGRVYHDQNLSGAPDPAEGIGSVTLDLTGTDIYGNTINRTLTTNADGAYTFDNLPPGTYSVIETQPAGFSDSKEVAGTSAGTVPPACPPAGNCSSNPAQNTISAITLAPNTQATGYLFEELSTATVSGFVYHDLNNNGQREGGETGIAGVNVTLTGTDYAGNAVSLNAVTAGNGQYTFNNVPPSGPGGYTITETAEPNGFIDGRDQNGAGAGNVVAGSAGRPVPETLTLPQAQVTPGATLSERNFGELQTSTLTGNVYADENGNGTREGGETVGIPGTTITLTGTNDIGQAVNCSVTTNASGAYTFPNPADANPLCRTLRPGTYTVTETIPGGLTSTGAQPGSQGGAAGAAPGTQFVQNVVITASGTNATGYDFGHQGTLLGGAVYVDTNDNGLRDPGEPGIPGVAVTLTGTTAGNADVCTILPACTVTTDNNGNYTFPNVPGSNGAGYTLREINGAGVASPILSSYVDGIDRAGTVAGAAVGTAGNDVINGVVINVGQIGANYNFGERGQSLSGTVYGDDDNDGIRQPGEAPIAGVTITLSGLTTTGVDVCTIVLSCTVVTDASGNYVFANLPAGTYTLTETQPAGFGDGRETAGSLGGTVDDASFTGNPAQNRIANVTLATGQLPGGQLRPVPADDNLRYRPYDLYGFVQGTASRSGNRTDNDRVGAGASWQATDRLRLLGEVSAGDGGAGGRLGGDWRIDDRSNAYLTYSIENERPDAAFRGRFSNLVSGTRYRLNDRAATFGETRWSTGAGPESLTHAFGLDYAPADRWTTGVKFETGSSPIRSRAIWSATRSASRRRIATTGRGSPARSSTARRTATPPASGAPGSCATRSGIRRARHGACSASSTSRSAARPAAPSSTAISSSW